MSFGTIRYLASLISAGRIKGWIAAARSLNSPSSVPFEVLLSACQVRPARLRDRPVMIDSFLTIWPDDDLSLSLRIFTTCDQSSFIFICTTRTEVEERESFGSRPYVESPPSLSLFLLIPSLLCLCHDLSQNGRSIKFAGRR